MSQQFKYISEIALQRLPQTTNAFPKLQFTSSHHRLWILLLRTSQSFTAFFCYFSVSSNISPCISRWFAYTAFSLSVSLGIISLATMEAVNLASYILTHPCPSLSFTPFFLFFYFSQYSFLTIFGKMNILCLHVLFQCKYCSQNIPFLVQSYFPLELIIVVSCFFFFFNCHSFFPNSVKNCRIPFNTVRSSIGIILGHGVISF